MSCAPRLISLSSSGKRYESVSRESSVHSMMSMNCLLMKSRMAISRLLLLRRKLLRFRLALVDLAFELWKWDRSGDHRPVRENQSRRRHHAQAVTEERRILDRRRAIALVVGQLAAVEEVVPGLGAVGGAPDHR